MFWNLKERFLKYFNKNIGNSQLFFAFTLAEVLITLAIIGVVAAMTIPTLISSYQKNVTIESLKKTYSVLNNAIENAKVDYGTDVNQWAIQGSAGNEKPVFFAKTYILPYIKTIVDCTENSTPCTYPTFALNGSACSNFVSGAVSSYIMSNGTIISIWVGQLSGDGSTVGQSRVQIRIDLNGSKKPNTVGKDIFMIELGGGEGDLGLDKNKFLPYAWNIERDRNSYKTGDPSIDCSKNGGGSECFALIMVDGWKIADDYPWN